ncbi:nucleotide exchange factor GrpE [Bacillus shivajii]|uniref:nucleotide exchange factor GrpE n=1 Tax=Bacillus shivajii TaxID=1983719 RepID=UPI001CF99E16|nr:nucleotide exchange factor GrpE [Bacillus shivajii]UCZ54485.1 nucleotide exchange factor GrpE [Bacillus shivajii]
MVEKNANQVDQETVEKQDQEQSEEVEQELVEDHEVEEAMEESSSDEIAKLEQKVQEATDRLLRVQADYDNFRRRTKQEKEAEAKYRSQRLAEEILPVLDNFERGLAINPESDETNSLLQGMEMVYRQLKDALEKEGVKPIQTVGETFDPQIHQAVMQVESDEYDSNVVVEELQKGYKLNDRVIRPAMVKVNA